jgi:hypothetical protein
MVAYPSFAAPYPSWFLPQQAHSKSAGAARRITSSSTKSRSKRSTLGRNPPRWTETMRENDNWCRRRQRFLHFVRSLYESVCPKLFGLDQCRDDCPEPRYTSQSGGAPVEDDYLGVKISDPSTHASNRTNMTNRTNKTRQRLFLAYRNFLARN